MSSTPDLARFGKLRISADLQPVRPTVPMHNVWLPLVDACTTQLQGNVKVFKDYDIRVPATLARELDDVTAKYAAFTVEALRQVRADLDAKQS